MLAQRILSQAKAFAGIETRLPEGQPRFTVGLKESARVELKLAASSLRMTAVEARKLAGALLQAAGTIDGAQAD